MKRFSNMMWVHLSLGFALVAGCDGDVQERTIELADAPASTAASLKQASSFDAPENWRAWVDAEVVRLQSQRSELYNRIKTMEPVTTRAGSLRFAIEEQKDPQMLPLLIDRLIHENNPSEVRQALAASLTQTGADYSAAALDLLTQEDDPKVRLVMVERLRRVTAPQALAGLEDALQDVDASVREQAAYTIGSRPDGTLLADQLLKALDDNNGNVRLQATKTLGALKVEEAKPALTALLASPSGDQRLHALRALGRIDIEYARSLQALADLERDNDPRVVRAVSRLRK